MHPCARTSENNMAGRFASKIFRHCQHAFASDFRPCVVQGTRWNSSSSKPKRLRIDDIRWFCKTGKPQDISQLFHQLLELPDKYRTNSVNSALYWFSHYEKIDEALELKTLMEEHGIPKNYSTYSCLAVLYSKSGQLENTREFFDEMTRNGLTPRARHYAPFVEMAIEKGDLLGAFNFMKEMQSAAINERDTDIYTSLISACTGTQNRQLTDQVLGTFHDFRNYRDLLSYDTLEAIKLWFDRQVIPKWKTSWSTVSVTYHCQACKQKLESGQFSAAELEDLKQPLADLLWSYHKLKTLRPVKCFTSAGNYIDYVQLGENNKFPRSIEQFMKATGPYDVVVDGLNVGYFTSGFFDPRKVENVVLHFLKQNKRVLVVGSSPIRMDFQKKRNGDIGPLQGLINYLSHHQHCGVFCLKESSIDDVYFLSAAVHCGPGTLLVSRDMFSNHISRMDLWMKIQFRRWQKLHQMVLERFIGDNPVFAVKKPYDSAVQTTGDTWHFPSSDGKRWLCVRKAGTVSLFS